MKKTIFVFAFICSFVGLKAQTEKIFITEWLALPAQTLELPVFHDRSNTLGKKFDDENLLNFDQHNLSGYFPEANKFFKTMPGNQVQWLKKSTGDQKFIVIGEPDNQPQLAYVASYIWADRWMSATIEVNSPYLLTAWLNGEEIGNKAKVDDDPGMPGKISKNVKLERGKHLLLVKSVKPAGKEADWEISATLEVKEPFKAENITITTDPTNRMNIYHILDGVKITNVDLSHDGKFYAISYRRSLPPGDESENWTEIKRSDNRQLVHSFRHAKVSQLKWLPNSNRISYVASQNNKSTIFIFALEKGTINPLLQDVENLAGYSWAPNEKFLIYTIYEKPEKKETIMNHLLCMEDRQPNWRNRSFLHLYNLATGEKQRLTWGNLTTSLHDISPDSKKIIFSQSFTDYEERPFSKQNLFLMDLETFTLDTIQFEESWGVRVSFSPDGNFLLASGGPESFNAIGLNLSAGKIPHNSDTQLFIYDLKTKSVKPITRDFDPSVESAHWHAVDNHIYIIVTEEDYRRLYRYDLARQRFTLIETGTDYITTINFAGNALKAAYIGNLTNRYSVLYSIDLRNPKVNLLEDTESENYRHVEFGQTKNWDFTTSGGLNIKGRVYYPPYFDASKKYPVIVYFYAGITPVGRTFGGRYPLSLWAGNDYLVYVLQPSGAIGFGQEFSAAHVNNWGFTVADEIIEGTQKFLEAHPYADETKVGAAGASYGGFMTMLLLTRTNIFTAAFSHAGISSISSYWGEGFWGYSYSAGASAYSFPWNNKDLYIGQSPLFHADKINTPLLLLTGDADTNVPPGESIQMYTALKLLGRPVELILVKGEDHHILTYNKRILWHKAIMAWWDKHLKGQGEWWQDQFPEKNF